MDKGDEILWCIFMLTSCSTIGGNACTQKVCTNTTGPSKTARCGCLSHHRATLSPPCWMCEQRPRAPPFCQLLWAPRFSGGKGFLSKCSCRGSCPEKVCVQWHFSRLNNPLICQQAPGPVGSKTGHEAWTGSALLSNRLGTRFLLSLEKILLPAPGWLYYEK